MGKRSCTVFVSYRENLAITRKITLSLFYFVHPSNSIMFCFVFNFPLHRALGKISYISICNTLDWVLLGICSIYGVYGVKKSSS